MTKPTNLDFKIAILVACDIEDHITDFINIVNKVSIHEVESNASSIKNDIAAIEDGLSRLKDFAAKFNL